MGLMGIYAIRHKSSDKKYVGSTVEFQTRKATHLNDLKKKKHFNKHLQSAYNKYGKDEFEFVMLETITKISKEELLEKEKQWILKLNTIDSNFGYNMTCETKSPMLGKKASEETKKKLSLCRQGSKHANSKINEDSVRLIFDLHYKGFNQKEIADQIGIDQTNISLILRGKAWNHVGLKINTPRANNTSGCVGVYFVKSQNKWKAEIIHDKKYKGLGYFDDMNQAINARKQMEVSLGL